MRESGGRYTGRGRGGGLLLVLACLLAACSSGSGTGAPFFTEQPITVDCEAFPSSAPKAQFVAFDDHALKLQLLRQVESAVSSADSKILENPANGFPISREYMLSWTAINYARLGAYDHAMRVAGDLEEDSDAELYAITGIASAYATRGKIEEARKLTVSLRRGSPWHAWDRDTLSIYAAAALARKGDFAAARRKLRDLGVEDAEIDWRIAPWMADAGRAGEALTLLRDAMGLKAYTRAKAFAALSQAAFRAGNVRAGREAALEAHRIRRDAGYSLLGVTFVDLTEHMGLVDLLYSEEQDAAASTIARELTEDLIRFGEEDTNSDALIFEILVFLFEIQRGYGDVEGAERSLKAMRRRASVSLDAEEHWARVAAARQVWTMIMDGQVISGVRLAESLSQPAARCSALGNAVVALSSRRDFPRAWQLAESTIANGDCEGITSPSGFEAAYFPSRPPFGSIALIALSKGDPDTACRALGRIEENSIFVTTALRMVSGLARGGHLDVAAEIVDAIGSDQFQLIAVLEAIEPRRIGPRVGLPLREWWGEALPYLNR